jgi:hypothetical protein
VSTKRAKVGFVPEGAVEAGVLEAVVVPDSDWTQPRRPAVRARRLTKRERSMRIWVC